MTTPTNDDEICRAAIAALGVRCRPTEELVTELATAGIDLGSHAVDRLEAVLHGHADFIDLDAGWVGVGATLDGTRWITAVDAEGARLDCLAFSPDLLPLGWWALDAPLTLAGTAEALTPDDDVDADLLIGPRGWLDPYADAHVEVRIDGTTLHLAPAGAVDAPADMVSVLREIFEQHATFEELRDFDGVAADLTQIGVDELLWESLVARRDLFTAQPIPPIDVLVAAAGFIRDGHAVLRGDVDAAALHAWRLRNHLASTYDLEGDQIEQAEIAIGISLTVMSDAVDPLGPPDEMAGAARFFAALLEDESVCDALFGHHLDTDTPPLELAAFARLIVDNLTAGEGAGPRWLLGRALDFGDDSHGALAALEGAVATGEEHPLALIALAGFRADAGAAREAVALLRRAAIEPEHEAAGDPADDAAFELLREISGFAARSPGAQAGRNDPCPCGSGRKYKACHLGKERHDLVDRGPWLYAKTHRYMRAHRAPLVVTIAEEMSVGSGEEVSVFDVLDSYLVADIACCEGGAGAAFVAARGAVLPDDEAELAARWVSVERSLFEVEERKDTTLRLHDLRSDAHITLSNMNRGSDSRPGDLLLGRPLPIADAWRTYAGLLKVEAAMRDDLLDVLARRDPVEIAAITGRCVAMARARGDGRTVDLHALIDQDLGGGDEPARLRTGSDERERRSRPDDAETTAGPDDQVTDFERLWLDEPVPALGGLTPRQAANDPIARDDLERLLDGFEGRAGVMNISRLRKALGLSTWPASIQDFGPPT